VCAIYATRDVHELSTGKAAAVVLIPVAVITVIVALILTTHLIDTMEKYDEQYTEIMPMVDMMGTMETMPTVDTMGTMETMPTVDTMGTMETMPMPQA